MAPPLRERTLALLRPDLAAQWHPSKNGDLTPETVTAKSSRSIWWECSYGHEFRTAPFNRKDDTCPTCKKIGRGSVLDDPELAPWLHPDKNIHVDLSSLAPTSTHKIWWLFECGHEQQSTPHNRRLVKWKNLCGPCSKAARIKGTIPLSTLSAPMAWWRADENPGLNPADVGKYSLRDVVWTCPRAGHTFTAAVVKMVRKQYCPECGESSRGARTLDDVRPDIDSWWHPTLNGELRPRITPAYRKTVIWLKCPKRGHVFSREARSISESLTCKECALLDSTARQGKPSHEVAQNIGLHIALNEDRQDVTTKLFSRRLAWFVCTRGHTWEMPMYLMQTGRGCPDCPDGLATEGVNGMDVTHPHLSKWWHGPKNQTFTMSKLTADSREKAWWMCDSGHLIQIRIRTVSKNGLQCGRCEKLPAAARPKVTAAGGRSVAESALAAWYAPTSGLGNKGRSPKLVGEFSKSQRRWFGKCGHWWTTSPERMSKRTLCPKCGCTEPPPNEQRAEIWANRRSSE